MDEVQRDWSRILLLEEVSERFDALDVALCKSLQPLEPPWSACDDAILSQASFLLPDSDKVFPIRTASVVQLLTEQIIAS